MMRSWISLYPRKYVDELNLLAERYPEFRADETSLEQGRLVLYGELIVRPSTGSCRHAVELRYPAGYPFEHPIVTPLKELPDFDKDGELAEEPQRLILDVRHQMPRGNLCLFQRETRETDLMTGVDVLRRAEDFLYGHHSGRWPREPEDAELETHFTCGGDVLVAQTFLGDDFSGHGRLTLVRSYADVAELGEECARFMVTAATEESRIIRIFDARHELCRLYPWVAKAAWDAEAVAAASSPEPTDFTRFVRGYWWSLPHEPPPFRDGKGLLEQLSLAFEGDVDAAWDRVQEQLGTYLTVGGGIVVGLRYPARRSGFEWLFVLSVWEQQEKVPLVGRARQNRDRFEATQVYCLRTSTLTNEAMQLRNTGKVDDSVRGKTVALIGLGALGSKVAELLAQAGVGRFRLCDKDNMEIGNVARHVGGVTDFGKPKTEVVADRLYEVNPYLEFGPNDIKWDSAVASLDTLAAFIADADLTIVTTADEAVENVINQVAVIDRRPVLYGRSMRGASVGRTFLVRPGRDACKRCLGLYLEEGRRGEETPDDWVDVPDDDRDVVLHECGRPVIAASAVDLSFIAGLIARKALDFLEGRTDGLNHWLWSKSPADDLDERLSAPLSTLMGEVPQHPHCPACQRPEIAEVLIAGEAMDDIRSHALASPSAETCGILIGFLDNENHAFVRCATEPGPNASRSRGGCSRDVEFVQEELDRAAQRWGARGLYVGEWHTHLSISPHPSATDTASLLGIAEALNYPTRCPVMILACLSEDGESVEDISCWVYPLDGQGCQVPLTAVDSDAIAELMPMDT